MAFNQDSLNGISLSKINPNYLHANSTSHVWAFGAIAELIDNAYDPDVKASHISIDKIDINKIPCLVFVDNGAGMNREQLLKMLRSKDITENNLQPILKYSPFKSENELKDQIDNMKDSITGTKIIIYNLSRLEDGTEELDFQSDPEDILCPESYMKNDTNADFRPVEHVPEYKKSLRAFCSILYLCPKMKISVRKVLVKSKYVSKMLKKTAQFMYKPQWLKHNKKSIKIVLGLSCERDWNNNYGFFLYYKNRMIKAYEKIGCQKQSNGKGVGVIGVAELDFLTPTHNKQDFVQDGHYNTVMNALSAKLLTYWDKVHNGANGEEDNLPDWTWAQCDRCLIWRRLPSDTDPKSLPNVWFCHMNSGSYYNRCFMDQEPEDETPKKRGRRSSSRNSTQSASTTPSIRLFLSQPETTQDNSDDAVVKWSTRSVDNEKDTSELEDLSDECKEMTPHKKKASKRRLTTSLTELDTLKQFRSIPTSSNLLQSIPGCSKDFTDSGDYEVAHSPSKKRGAAITIPRASFRHSLEHIQKTNSQSNTETEPTQAVSSLSDSSNDTNEKFNISSLEKSKAMIEILTEEKKLLDQLTDHLPNSEMHGTEECITECSEKEGKYLSKYKDI
uniref:CW-type domain-containing protein n=1 Tax=Biomphalaria glabrata TaxID=6526 RepID=A0A2C9LDD7_BIOGL